MSRKNSLIIGPVLTFIAFVFYSFYYDFAGFMPA